jgi:hypothetical protein
MRGTVDLAESGDRMHPGHPRGRSRIRGLSRSILDLRLEILLILFPYCTTEGVLHLEVTGDRDTSIRLPFCQVSLFISGSAWPICSPRFPQPPGLSFVKQHCPVINHSMSWLPVSVFPSTHLAHLELVTLCMTSRLVHVTCERAPSTPHYAQKKKKKKKKTFYPAAP